MVGAAILMLDLMLLPLPLLQQLPLLPLLLDDLMLLLLELELWLLLRLTLLPLPLPEQVLAWKSHHVQWVRCAAASLASRPCPGTRLGGVLGTILSPSGARRDLDCFFLAAQRAAAPRPEIRPG